MDLLVLLKKQLASKIRINQNVFETGISNFHLLNVTELKIGFQKLPPNLVKYQDYKNYDNKKIRADI